REAEALGEVLAYLVAVECLDPEAGAAQLVRHGARQRGLAGPGQTGEPDRESARLREASGRRQLGLSHCSALSSPLSAWWRGGQGVRQTKKARFHLEAGPR